MYFNFALHPFDNQDTTHESELSCYELSHGRETHSSFTISAIPAAAGRRWPPWFELDYVHREAML